MLKLVFSAQPSKVFKQGFTFLEALVVMVMIATLMSIAAPSWLAFLEKQRVSDAQDIIFQSLKLTQSKAQRTAKDWRFAMQQQTNQPIQWAIYPRYSTSGSIIDPTKPSAQVNWQTLHSSLDLTIPTSASQSGTGGRYYSALFNYKGNATKRLTFTVVSNRNPEIKRCVIMSTLLGNVRKAKDEDCG